MAFLDLADRQSDGITVELLMDTETKSLFIRLDDRGQTDQFEVPPQDAVEAFYHPFAYCQK